MAKEITKKMRDFADAYLETGNIYQSAIRAGYSENYAKGNARYLFENERVQKYINETMESIHSKKVADIQEVMEYLTKGIRHEGCGDGISEAVVKKKKISLKDSNKCAEMLAKRFGMFTDTDTINVVVPVFGGEDNLAE